MKIINMDKGHYALVDDNDFELLNRHKWYYQDGYAVTKIGGKTVLMHRLIMNTPKGMHTDHINHNKLDNRKENLRIVTAKQNHMNRQRTGVFKGVSIMKNRRKPFVARIKLNKEQFLGSYDTPEEAARAYDKAAKELFGEYAWLNFPEDAK